MIKPIKQFIGFIFFVGPIALFWFIPWYWVVLYYNLYWTYTSYIIYEANKDKKELSLLYCISLPLLFNFFGFLVVILTESKSKKVNEESSSNDSSDTLESNQIVVKTNKEQMENTKDVINILEGYYSRLSEKEYQLKAKKLWREFFIKKISENGHDISEIDKVFSDKENGFTIGNETEVMLEYDGLKFDSILFYLWWYENGDLSDYEVLDIELPVLTDKEVTDQNEPCLIFNFKYEEDKVILSFKNKYDIGFWGNIDEISNTLSRLPIFKLSDNSIYTIVYLFDKDGNEYRYSINESDIPEEINDEDDVEINIALKYHDLLNRPIIPDDPEVEGDDENTYSFKYYTDGLELTDKQLASEEADMIPKEFISSSIEEKKVDNNNREVLTHQVEYGLFLEDSGDVIHNQIKVNGQRHLLVREYQSWDNGQQAWCEYESETENEFYLTANDKGYRYDEDDLVKFFEIEDWEWTFNGTNIVPGCGIEEDDDDDTIQKKWNDYKNKFPVISRKSQFDISGIEKKNTDINFCPNCGVKITEKINFCGDCGQKLN
jgi:hypothetical protein